MKSLLKTAVLFFLLLGVTSNLSIGQTNNQLFEITPQIGLKYFYWGEYNDESVLALEEFGLLYFGGLNIKTKFSNSFDLYVRGNFEFYLGLLNYNGYLQDAAGNTDPFESETGYLGLEFLLHFGYDFRLSRCLTFAPEFGLGYENWERDIDNGGQYGYDELWEFPLFNFGCNFIIRLSHSSKIYFKIIGKSPLTISESVDLESRGQGGSDDISLEPGTNIGINLELGAVISGAYFSFYFDYIPFSKSALDQNYHQPESERSLAGLKLGYQF